MHSSKKTHLATIASGLVISICLGCTRSIDSNQSSLAIPLPSQSLFSSKSLGKGDLSPQEINGRKECYAVSVRGERISDTTRTCGPTTGAFAGFRGAGETISVTVPSKVALTIDVYLLLLPVGYATCPEWNSDFEDSFGSIFYSTYKVGTTSNVVASKDNEVIPVLAKAPTNLDLNLMTELDQTDSCKVTASAQLLESGDIVDANESTLNIENTPLFTSVSNYISGLFSSNSLFGFFAGGLIQSPSGDFQTPPYIDSIVRFPNQPSKILGLQHDGNLVALDLTTNQALEIAAANCPISTCQVPVWMKSIALDSNNRLYSIDHGGNVYYLSKSGPLPTSTQLPPYIHQIAF